MATRCQAHQSELLATVPDLREVPLQLGRPRLKPEMPRTLGRARTLTIAQAVPCSAEMQQALFVVSLQWGTASGKGASLAPGSLSL